MGLDDKGGNDAIFFFIMITNGSLYIFIKLKADTMYIVRYNSNVKEEGDIYAKKKYK